MTTGATPGVSEPLHIQAPVPPAQHGPGVEGAQALGWALAVWGSVPIVCQLAHTRRTRSTAGIAAGTHVAWLCSWLCWLAYAVSIKAWPIALETALGAVLEAIELVWLMRLGLRVDHSALAWVLGVLGIGVVGMLAGADAAAVAITAYDVGGVVPQSYHALRAPDLEGISGWSWAVTLASALGWCVYAAQIGHPWAASWPVTAALASGVVLGAKRLRTAPATA